MLSCSVDLSKKLRRQKQDDWRGYATTPLREEIFNLNSGTNFVRRIETEQGEFCIIYCCSSYRKDYFNYFRFAANANSILSAGDFAYNYLLPIFQENCYKFTLPKIDESSEVYCEDVSALINNYTLIEKFSEKIIAFTQTSPIIDESDYRFKQQLRLVVKNKIHLTATKDKTSKLLLSRVK